MEVKVEESGLNSNDKKKEEEKSLTKDIIETAIYFIVCIAVILCIRVFVVQHVKVDGSSMYPTLQDKEHLLVEKISYKRHDIERYDIVVFHPHSEKSDVYFVKRVIGLPGETIWIEDGKIHVKKKDSDKDEVLDESYGKGDTEPFDASKKVTLKDDEYFVLGDNREQSRDSRDFTTVGMVEKDSIMGKAWKVIWPFDKIGSIEEEKK